MKDIKFKVWDKKYKRFIEGGELIYYLYSGNERLEVNINELGYENDEYKQSDFVICQFTGVTDKNGKEIYEGDIVKYLFIGDFEKKYDLYEYVIFYKGCSVFNNSKRGLMFFLDDLEVLGNIYENLELLKGEIK
jgi:uncharacterized phage protein (TIGR01671 family)